MSLFEYLGVFLSVIMGLGVIHLLTGVSKTVHARDTVRIYWVHLVWAFNTFLFIIAIWWGMFWWSGQEQWSFFQFLFIILYAILLFFLSSLLYPWSFPADFDFEKHFYRTRRWFFGTMMVCWLVDIPETMFKAQEGLRDLPEAYLVFALTQVILAALAMVIDNKRFHAVYCVLWTVLTMGYLGVSTLYLGVSTLAESAA